jgi:hypothetical protein
MSRGELPSGAFRSNYLRLGFRVNLRFEKLRTNLYREVCEGSKSEITKTGLSKYNTHANRLPAVWARAKLNIKPTNNGSKQVSGLVVLL